MDESPATNNIVIFLNERVCSECENFLQGPSGGFCRTYREDIDDERVAAECTDYEPVPWAGRRRP